MILVHHADRLLLGFYISKHSPSDSWTIYLEDGGWCFDQEECLAKSQTDSGSSRDWPAARNNLGGVESLLLILSDSTSDNPDLSAWNKVVIPSCDGSSLSSTASQSIINSTASVWLEGLNIFEETISTLIASQNLAKAQQIILAGSGSGGLAVGLHLDRLESKEITKKIRNPLYVVQSGYDCEHLKLALGISRQMFNGTGRKNLTQVTIEVENATPSDAVRPNGKMSLMASEHGLQEYFKFASDGMCNFRGSWSKGFVRAGCQRITLKVVGDLSMINSGEKTCKA
ncbi:hypothetical protein GUITHDRAFT_143891 [Guillardia theta CCMP2712]|uniref:Uncharacterized protein n=1 Tax=Guillardia theta (strain CCMP2712) TaxID=905079 RepID=L1ISK8_GUITC|nr:hypothetical protein GUITHDRAFT_143891 [Guillardia theta CCMP2712]EKX38879.1 hypothetical protein GUITHDRAFT_143891 [Guillardia theta CCMP2712]|eukprot:XP_005825859.1 hypothetical protein GUITHDRAFT_143891 [Guillardia theta CCMP2712]